MNGTGCQDCGGTGFVLVDSEGVARARRCACRVLADPLRALERARIPQRFAECTLEGFHPQATLLQQEAKRAAQAFVEDYPVGSARQGLLFLGPPGVGKTHLAVAILRSLILDKGVGGLFFDYSDLLRTIQSTWDRDALESEASVLEPVTGCEVLLLDDLGAARPTAWVQGVLFHILNSRYNAARITLLTSNHLDASDEGSIPEGRRRDLHEASLEHQIGVRLRSRLYEMCLTVPVDGRDWRSWGSRGNVAGQRRGG